MPDDGVFKCGMGPDGGECELCQAHPSIILMSHIPQLRNDGPHTIPLGAVVECDINVDDGWGADDIHKEEGKELCIGVIGKVRLYVVGYHNDCDGTPLYMLAAHPVAYPHEEKMFSPRYNFYHTIVGHFHGGIPGDVLKVVGQAKLKTLDEHFGI